MDSSPKREEEQEVLTKNENDGVEKMSQAFMKLTPTMEKIESKYNALLESQEELLEISKEENSNLSENKTYEEIGASFNKIPQYITKLKKIKRDSRIIQDKLKRLKRKSENLKKSIIPEEEKKKI